MKTILSVFVFVFLSMGLYSQNAASVYNMGLSAYNSGNKALAMQYYTKSIEMNPKFIEAYVNRGNLKGELGDYAGAFQDHLKVVEMDMYKWNAWQGLGLACKELGLYTDAIGHFKSALLVAPPDKAPYIYYELGRSEHLNGDKNNGCAHLRKSGEMGYVDAYKIINGLCN